MPKQLFVNYWIGQEPNPPSPTLDEMPAYVDIVPLAFVQIDDAYQLSFGFLTQHFSAAQIQGWIKTVQANGTKVLLSINDRKLGSIPADQQDAFVRNVAESVAEWGVDGLDFDYEPPEDSDTLVPLIQSLRDALPEGSVFTAPVYGAWMSCLPLLGKLAGVVDYFTTMDYTPYPGFDATISACEQYAQAIGGWSKLLIGVSCMGPSDGGNFTPLDDVKRLSAYVPEGGEAKGGAMLYTFSYDVTSRNNGTTGTGQPDGTWTAAVHESLPDAG
jgi:hypothetical protein